MSTPKVRSLQHCRLGANYWDKPAGGSSLRRFSVRENTIPSFLKSVAAGASFIEFDVQVTRDGVPVIWHDNYVITGSPEQPINRLISDLTYGEFVSLVPASADLHLQKAGQVAGLRVEDVDRNTRLLRALGGDEPAERGNPTLAGWEAEMETRLPSLAEIFATIPAHVAFDIEIKVATSNRLAHTPLREVDRLLTAILSAVDDAQKAAVAAGRPCREILYSSFDPDVCAELAYRRPNDSIMFLSGGGQYIHADPRRTSFRAAIEWAKGAKLAGVIFHAGRLRSVLPQITHETLEAGLQMMTYGQDNTDAGYVEEQYAAGVRGVIVDDVSSVVEALTKRGLSRCQDSRRALVLPVSSNDAQEERDAVPNVPVRRMPALAAAC